jgi:hypothetical protein
MCFEFRACREFALKLNEERTIRRRSLPMFVSNLAARAAVDAARYRDGIAAARTRLVTGW